MLKEILRIWQDFRPRITYKAKEDKMLLGYLFYRDEVNAKCTWEAIRPVIFSLEELKKNTWDIERIEHVQNWLVDNFKIPQ